MNYRSLSSCLLISLACAVPIHADTLKLREGKKVGGKTELEGRVLSQDAKSVVFEYKANASGSIREKATIPKADIDTIVQEDQAAKAFKPIEALIPTPDLLSAADYAPRLAEVEAFITKYAASDLAGDAKAIRSKLKAEVAAIEAGGIKVDGKIITQTEINPDAYQFDVKMMAAKVRTALKNKANLEALRAFLLFDESFPTSSMRRELAPEISKIIRYMRSQIAPLADSFDARMEKHKAKLDQITGPDGDAIRLDWEQTLATLESRYQTEKAAGQRWVTPNENHLGSLQDFVSQADSEIARLSQPVQAVTGPDPAAAYRAAWKAINDKDDAEKIDKAVNEVRAAGLSDKYINLLKAAAAAAGVEASGL